MSPARMTADIDIRHELQAGDLGRIVALHGECYDSLPGFGLAFEAFVARTLSDYVLDTGANGRIWLAERDGQLVACTAIVLREDQQAQLRWVLVDPTARGIGLGKKLLNRAIEFSRDNACTDIVLETTNGLPESQQLYDSLDFKVISNEPEPLWDGVRPLILMQLHLV
ncbi:MAG: GNAT family N-acetyltransferase [Gammaproteobacteria bacterium]|jgi:peptidyl-dipeptidase Dcp|nr:GNAT family N-acetyltransferase [Gammaproteobacteria bacterium]